MVKDIFEKTHRKIKLDFESSAGRKHIFAETWVSDLSRKSVHFVFLHGALEYHRNHLPLFRWLKDYYGEKLQLSYMDFFGHGKSGGERSWVANDKVYTEDLLLFLKKLALSSKEKTGKLFFISHSMGGLVVKDLLIHHQQEIPFKIGGAIYSNPCLRPKLIGDSFFQRGLSILPSSLKKVHLPLLVNGYDLTSDIERAEAFNMDELINNGMTPRLAEVILSLSSKIRSLPYYYQTPSLYLLSGDDDIVDLKTTQQFLKLVPNNKVVINYYKNAKHDIFNEKNRIEVFQKIASWVQERIRK